MNDHEVRKFMRLFEKLTKDVARIADTLERLEQIEKQGGNE